MSQRPRKGVHLGAGDGGRKDQKRPLRSKEARPFFIVGGDGIRGGASVLPPFPLAPPQYGGNKGLSGPQVCMHGLTEAYSLKMGNLWLIKPVVSIHHVS